MRERINSLLRSLDVVSRTDMLTGLLDEGGFDEILEKELERARRSGNRVGLVVAEVDGEGTLAARLGDRRAEEALATIGAKLGGALRPNAPAARIAGARFAL